MSYREELKKRIRELQVEINNKQDHKHVLESELQSLLVKEFEEEMREENQFKPTLLKG